jgi:hypothetical protein
MNLKNLLAWTLKECMRGFDLVCFRAAQTLLEVLDVISTILSLHESQHINAYL